MTQAREAHSDEARLVDSVPLDGPLCEGTAVVVGWPEAADHDRITALRNVPKTRQWFLDRRILEPAANREWLAAGLDRPFESVLAIRSKQDSTFLGSIGWMDWQPAARRISIGRLMVDSRAVWGITSQLPAGYGGVAIDAAHALGGFVTSVMKVRFISYCFLRDNARARRVVELGGLVELERHAETMSDGRVLVIVETRVE